MIVTHLIAFPYLLPLPDDYSTLAMPFLLLSFSPFLNKQPYLRDPQAPDLGRRMLAASVQLLNRI